MVATFAARSSMKVIGFDPALPKDTANERGIQLMDLPDVWARSDFITVHTPLTPDTKDIINDDSISQVLCNTPPAVPCVQYCRCIYSFTCHSLLLTTGGTGRGPGAGFFVTFALFIIIFVWIIL